MKSSDAINIIKSRNIGIDFCYIDGSHYYENFKFDLENYSKIVTSVNEYKGILCGDDYEVSYDELLEEFEKKDVDKTLEEHKITDWLIYGKFHFHPGITLAIHKTAIKVDKLPSGFWIAK